MGFLSDMFLGARPDMALPGYASDLMRTIGASMPGMSFAGKQGKKLYKQYLKDPESLATQSLNQGAVERQTAIEDYGQGDNALLSQYGGEGQNALLQRMKENRIAKINQNQAINAQQEAAAKGFGGLNLNQNAWDSKQNTITQRYGLMGNILSNNSYDRTRKGGLLSADTLGKSVSGFVGGLGSGMGMAACWIAEALFGTNSFETLLLRHWINNVWAPGSRAGRLFRALYCRFGQRVARAVVNEQWPVASLARAVFNRLLIRARA